MGQREGAGQGVRGDRARVETERGQRGRISPRCAQ